MSSLIVPDQSIVLSNAGLVAPKLADFVAGVPLTSLLEIWRNTTGITVDGSNKVSEWMGYRGYAMSQADSSKRPLKTAGDVDFSGSGDYLTSLLTTPAQGYLVAKIKLGAIGTGTVILAAQSASASPFGRVGLGVSQQGKVGGYCGVKTVNNNQGTTVMTVGSEHVIGLGWDNAGNCQLRLDGTQEASTTYNSDGSTPGSGAFLMGALTTGGSATTAHTIEAAAIYSGSIDNTQRAAIDAAMAAF